MILFSPKLANLLLQYESACENMVLKKLLTKGGQAPPLSLESHTASNSSQALIYHLESTFVFISKYFPGTSWVTGT